MQLHLEPDELNLLANILLEGIGKSSAPGLAPDSGLFHTRMGLEPQFFDRVLDKVLARDLRLDGDELEQVGDILSAQREKMLDQLAQPENAARLTQLQRDLRLLDRLTEKITEVCVMF